ncbi:MAG: hypothetical protein KatS3mg114_1225 [Planctomycetaceae bacterium]|nr:MAG: hypothetical protein KatS3mg114_1225 [Planctomycetaceae bacterium]
MTTTGRSIKTMDAFISGLLRPEAYPHPVRHITLFETHISWIVLTGEYAYKIKKPVNFGFVDFSTLARRQWCCQEELRLNRRLAPEWYLQVVPIGGDKHQPQIGGPGPAWEYAVQMRQFDQSWLLPACLTSGTIPESAFDHLAQQIARFQAHADPAAQTDPWGSAEAVWAPVSANFDTLEGLLQRPLPVFIPLNPPQLLTQLHQLREAARTRHQALLDFFQLRRQQQRIREGHGDMHLGNMFWHAPHKQIVIFDCLEFNPALRWIDVLSELAFLVMDLWDRGYTALGWRVLNRWLEETADFASLPGWWWYVAYRAMVRAKVAGLRGEQVQAEGSEAELQRQALRTYLHLTAQAMSPPTPRLWVTCGVSGSGKSWAALQLACQVGAIRLRSDVWRRHLVSQGHIALSSRYSPQATQRVYDDLVRLADLLLASGLSVVVDATCLQRWQRARFKSLADRQHIPATLLHLTAPVPILQQRLELRRRTGGDPSEADSEVLQQQLARQQPPTPDEGWQLITLDTSRDDWYDALAGQLSLPRRESFPTV